jgi:hypothetical protein
MGGVQDARDNLKKSVTIFFTAAEQSHQFPNLPKSKSGKSGDFEIGLWSLAGADFETGATERALKVSKCTNSTYKFNILPCFQLLNYNILSKYYAIMML